MTVEATPSPTQGTPELQGQTVVVIGGSAGIGLATARLARDRGAEVVLAARNPERLEQAAQEVGARSTAAFDAVDRAALDRFFADLPKPVDHVLATAGGPYYAPLPEYDFAAASRSLDEHAFLAIRIAQRAPETVRPGGTLIFLGGTGGGKPAFSSAALASLPALIAGLALEIAPVRVNLIAAGFVDTPSRPRCSAMPSTSAATSCAPPFPSGAWSAPTTSPPSPSTSWPTPPSPARPTTSTAASS